MHSTTHNRSNRPHDTGTGGFIIWITVYAAFMLALIALNGTHAFNFDHFGWPTVAAAR